MKLIVTGATGLVATEIIRQSLQIPKITSVIALGRKPVHIDGANSTKLKSVVISDYGEYPDNVKAEFAGADACIWTVAITPFKAMRLDFAEVRRVCQDCTLAGLKAMIEAGPAKPFRVIYFSAEGTPQDTAQKPLLLGDYKVMRRETEKMVLRLAAEHEGTEVCIAHPGLVMTTSTYARAALDLTFRFTNMLTRAIPNVSCTEIATAVLGQVVGGFEKEVLSNADLVRLGRGT